MIVVSEASALNSKAPRAVKIVWLGMWDGPCNVVHLTLDFHSSLRVIETGLSVSHKRPLLKAHLALYLHFTLPFASFSTLSILLYLASH